MVIGAVEVSVLLHTNLLGVNIKADERLTSFVDFQTSNFVPLIGIAVFFVAMIDVGCCNSPGRAD